MGSETTPGTANRLGRTPDDHDEDDAEAEDAPPEGRFLPDLLRRTLTLGFTGFFMTEEAIRKALGETVPKDAIEYVLEQSERMRADFLEAVSKEFGRAMNQMDPAEMVARLLEGRTVEVSARFRILTDDDERDRAASRRKSRDRDDA